MVGARFAAPRCPAGKDEVARGKPCRSRRKRPSPKPDGLGRIAIRNGPRSRGPSPLSVPILVLPIMVTCDDHFTVAVAMIPAAMPAFLIPELGTRAVVIAVALIV